MRQRTTPNTISQTGVEGSTGGDKVEVIFRNCRVLSLSRKALLILFRFILMAASTSLPGTVVTFLEESVTTNQNDTRSVTLQSSTLEIWVVLLLEYLLIAKATIALKRYSSLASQAYALSPKADLILIRTLKAFCASAYVSLQWQKIQEMEARRAIGKGSSNVWQSDCTLTQSCSTVHAEFCACI